MSKSARTFIVPIYPKYHTELFPDSILNTESPLNFVENRPNRNAISKVYVSRSYFRALRSGDVVIFYHTASGGSAWYTAVATTLGIVESVITNIRSAEDFIRICRKRSVFTDAELLEHWNFDPRSRPFVVNFLYTYSFPKRPNRKTLIEGKIMDAEGPRGFKQLGNNALTSTCELSGSDLYYLID